MNPATKLLSRQSTVFSLVVLFVMLSLVAATTVLAQQQAASDDQSEVAQQPEVSLDDLIEDDEFVLSGEGYTYDPGDRRDPFKSLLVAREGPLMRGPRPEGIPGLLIDEIDLTGIFVTSTGPVAQVQSTQGEKSHLLHEGDQLYDGDVVSIGATEMVFKQIVDDPTAVKPFREVVKKLNP